MKLPVFSTSQDAYAAVQEVGAFFNGREPTGTFAREQDDGTLTFPTIDPDEAQEARTTQTGVPAFELLAGRVRRNFLMALKRDAQHAHATRGKLLVHAAQNHTIRLYDAGRQLELIGA